MAARNCAPIKPANASAPRIEYVISFVCDVGDGIKAKQSKML